MSNGSVITAEFTRQYVRVTEVYGMDADGRRGEIREMYEDESPKDIWVKRVSEVTTPLKEFSGEFQSQVTDAIEVWLRGNPPTEV